MNDSKIISRADIARVVAIAVGNWYIILLFPTTFFLAAYLYSYQLQEVYSTSCQILLKDESSVQSQFEQSLSSYSASVMSYDYAASQMKVMKSSSLVEKVLDKLELNVRYYIEGRFKTTEIYDHIPYKVVFDKQSIASNGVRFDLTFLDSVSYRLQYEIDGIRKDKVFEFGKLVLDDGLSLSIEPTIKANQIENSSFQDINYQFEIFTSNQLIAKYQAAIAVKSLSYTSVVEISLKDEIPARAEDFLEELTAYYIETTIQNKILVNENTVDYIDELLSDITLEVEQIEVELDSFKNGRDIINIEREEESYFNRLAELETQERLFEMELESLDDLAGYLLSSEGLETLMPPSLFLKNTDGQILQQLEGLLEKRKEYVSKLEVSKATNPVLVKLEEAIEFGRKDLLIYKNNQEKAILSHLEEIQRQIEEIRRKVKYLPTTERELMNIQKRISVNEKLYDLLLSKRAETLITKAGLVPQTKVIEKPRFMGVVYPNKTSIITNLTLVGAILAVFIVFIKEFFFRKVNSLNEMESLTKRTLLGSVPLDKQVAKGYVLNSASQRDIIIQSFRALRANLAFFPKAGKCHKILVTSLQPGEGKTFISANLASIFALANKRVLIIDLDMHKPRLHKVLDVPNDKGASGFLSSGGNLTDYVIDTHIKGMKAITAGPVPPNASELIIQKELDAIFEYAEANFDYLIIDTPPVALISDSLHLMPMVDTNLFVCSGLVTSRTSLDYINKIIEDHNVKGEALILNKERRTRLDYYYSRYGYGGYGYANYSSYGYYE
jgi:tyrosine-protein kinase Etk/Wzc